MGLFDDEEEKKDRPSRAHFWGGALSGGASVPASWAVGGGDAAKEGIKGAVVGGFFGLNSLLDDDDDDEA